MKKLGLIILMIVLCKFSFAQIDSFSYSTLKFGKTIVTKPRFYFKVNPFQYLLKQYNLTTGYRLNDNNAIEISLYRIEKTWNYFNTNWANGDACTAQVMNGYRIVLGFQLYESRYYKKRYYTSINSDFSYKVAKNESLYFTVKEQNNGLNLFFNQTRYNIGCNIIQGTEYVFFRNFLINVYFGVGLKYMYLKTERLKYIEGYNIISGNSLTAANNSTLLFNKSNYILPTVNLGVKFGFTF